MTDNKPRGRPSRFSVIFSTDGAAVTLQAGDHPPEVITLAAMPADVRRHCFEFGLETMTRNTVAGAEKNQWTNAQCHSYMARKVKSLVAGQIRMSDGAQEFHDFVSALVKHTGKSRADVENAILKWPQAKRDETRRHPTINRLVLEVKRDRLAMMIDESPTASELLLDI